MNKGKKIFLFFFIIIFFYCTSSLAANDQENVGKMLELLAELYGIMNKINNSITQFDSSIVANENEILILNSINNLALYLKEKAYTQYMLFIILRDMGSKYKERIRIGIRITLLNNKEDKEYIKNNLSIYRKYLLNNGYKTISLLNELETYVDNYYSSMDQIKKVFIPKG